MKQFLFHKSYLFVVLLILIIPINSIVYAAGGENDPSIDEKFGPPIVVYGEALSSTQKSEVRKLLGIKDSTKVREITVTGEDLVNYIHGDAHSNMYSSAKITRKETGEGLVINQVTPENITEVSNEMYANALLTAGIEDAIVDVASPVKVSGHSALVGIYKAYDEGKGNDLDKKRTEVASEELELATNLAKKEGLDQEKISELLTEIKKEIAKQNPATKEEIEEIIDSRLKSLEIQLSPEDRQLLVDLFNKMRDLHIDFDRVQSQLEDISNDIQNRISEALGDKGFLEAVSNFFKTLFENIKNLFS